MSVFQTLLGETLVSGPSTVAMEAAALQLATALLSKTWSGSSMLKGVSNALATVKTELPESETELQQMIQAS